MEIKYTSDGKKVIVIGSLNTKEQIVQEIFIIDGSEIPSGEHFVVSSLHDAPAVSWKENNLKKLEERYVREDREYTDLLNKLEKSYRSKSKELQQKLSYIGLALKNANEESFNTLVNFICGNIKFIVIDHYDAQLIPIEEFNQMYDDKLRLFSIFGKDDGSFTYAIGDYYDYSGGNKKFYPFTNYEDAFEKFKEIILKQRVSTEVIKLAKKYNITLDKDELDKFKEQSIKNLKNNIKAQENAISKWNESITEILNS